MDSKENNTPPPMSSERTAVGIFFLVLIALSASFSWRALFEAVLVPGGSVFFVPLLWFSLTTLLFALESVLLRNSWLIAALLLVVFGSSLFFAWSLWHLLFLVAGMTLGFLAIRAVQKELGERLHLAIQKSLVTGLGLFIFGLSLVISSQYYVHAQALSWEKLVPSFDLGEGSGAWVLRVMGPLYPPLQSLQDKEVTVDTFLREMRGGRTGASDIFSPEITEALLKQGIIIEDPAANIEVQKALAAKERASFSQLLGREVGGEERMEAVLSEVLRKKTLALVSGTNNTELPVPVIPFVLSILLFLSVYPVGSFLLPLLSGLAKLILFLFFRLKILALEKVSVFQERIV